MFCVEAMGTEFQKFAIQVIDIVFTFPELCMTTAEQLFDVGWSLKQKYVWKYKIC